MSAREENLLILRMLQEGTISAEQAAELLSAVSTSAAAAAPSAAAVAPVTPTAPATSTPAAPVLPPPPPVAPEASPPPPAAAPAAPPVTPAPGAITNDIEGGEAYTRARTRIAAAREAVAGVQERLQAAEDKLEDAPRSSNPWQAVADALKDVPGARSVGDALRGVDPHRIAANARRQARRLGRSVRSQLGGLGEDISSHLPLGGDKRGEPVLTDAREIGSLIVAPGGTLRVRNTLGDIEAFGIEEGKDGGAATAAARVEGTLRVWAAAATAATAEPGQTAVTPQSVAAQITLNVETGPDGPSVSVRHPAGGGAHALRGVSLDLRVYVPAGIKVSLLSPAGDVSAQRVEGAVVLATQNGDALAREIRGDVAAETASGDIGLEGIVGNVFATSASGDIAVVRAAGHALRLVTQSGDVRIEEIASTTIVVETVSGDVEARALVGAPDVRVRTVSGDVRASELAGSGTVQTDTVSGALFFTLQAPLSGTATLGTVSGDVELSLPPPGTGVNGARLDVTTKTGDVRGSLKRAGGEQKFNAAGVTGLAETLGDAAAAAEPVTTDAATAGRVVVTTVSGDITVSQE